MLGEDLGGDVACETFEVFARGLVDAVDDVVLRKRRNGQCVYVSLSSELTHLGRVLLGELVEFFTQEDVLLRLVGVNQGVLGLVLRVVSDGYRA